MIRIWGTFRLVPCDFRFFLLDHPRFQNSKITIESDKVNGKRYTYIDQEPYDSVTDQSNDVVYSSQLASPKALTPPWY